MAFCTKCGNRVPDDGAFCAKCGAARIGFSSASPAAAPPAAPEKSLSKGNVELAKVFLAIVGMVLVGLVAGVIIALGKFAVGLFALAATAGFVLLLFPRFAAPVRAGARMQKIIDPKSGEPLPMLWWCRWFTAALAIILFASLGNSNDSPDPQTPKTASAVAPPEAKLSADEQILGRSVFCLVSLDAAQHHEAKMAALAQDIVSARQQLQDNWHYSAQRADEILTAAGDDLKAGLWSADNCPQYILNTKMPDGSRVGGAPNDADEAGPSSSNAKRGFMQNAALTHDAGSPHARAARRAICSADGRESVFRERNGRDRTPAETEAAELAVFLKDPDATGVSSDQARKIIADENANPDWVPDAAEDDCSAAFAQLRPR
jgi:hypothetical protein